MESKAGFLDRGSCQLAQGFILWINSTDTIEKLLSNKADHNDPCLSDLSSWFTFWQTKIAMKNGPFEDVFPIENEDIPLLCWFTTGYPEFEIQNCPRKTFFGYYQRHRWDRNIGGFQGLALIQCRIYNPAFWEDPFCVFLSPITPPGNDHISPSGPGTFQSMIFQFFLGGICDGKNPAPVDR